VEVATPADIPTRVEIVRRRDAYDRDQAAFCENYREPDGEIRARILSARAHLRNVAVSDAALTRAATLCQALGTDGLRGELTLIRAARALAALEGAAEVTDAHLMAVAPSALRHRLRRNPLDDSGSSVRVERAVSEVFA
jgi:magnesium chelatase subunit I